MPVLPYPRLQRTALRAAAEPPSHWAGRSAVGLRARLRPFLPARFAGALHQFEFGVEVAVHDRVSRM